MSLLPGNVTDSPITTSETLNSPSAPAHIEHGDSVVYMTVSWNEIDAGIAQAAHLAVQDDVLLLHPVVMSARDDLVVARQHGADRQAALRDAERSASRNRFRHEFVMMGFDCHGQCCPCERGLVLPTSVGRAISASNMSRMRRSASSSVYSLSRA